MPEPVAVPEPSSVTTLDVDRALSRIRACLDPRLLVLFSCYLEAVVRERAHGGLDISFDTYDGTVAAARFDRRTHWKRAASSKP